VGVACGEGHDLFPRGVQAWRKARGLSNPLGLPFPQWSHHLHADKSDMGTSKRGHRGMHTLDGRMHVRASSTRKVRGRGSSPLGERATTPTSEADASCMPVVLSLRKAKSMATARKASTAGAPWSRVVGVGAHAGFDHTHSREKRRSTEQCRASGQIEPRDTHF
jgi:hypothetical protein